MPYCSYIPLLHHTSISIRNCCAILFLYTSVTSHSPFYRLLLHTVSVPISSILLFHIVLVCLCYITPPSLYETALPYCFCTHLFHTTVSCCSTRPYLYETAVSYCSCMPLLHHASLSIRDYSVILVALLFAVYSLQQLW